MGDRSVSDTTLNVTLAQQGLPEPAQIFANLGTAALVVSLRIDYHRWRRWVNPLLVITAGLMAAVLVPGLGVNVNDGMADVLSRVATLTDTQQTAIEADIAALRSKMVRLAAEVGDGLIGHPMWSIDWTLERMKPEFEAALAEYIAWRAPFCDENGESLPPRTALVVTSPPYFAGKAYEESLGENGVPADYFEYLAMLERVFAECERVLEPGGRIAVNVANLGRKPYRSLSADVIRILEHDLGLLLRGELIWQKADGASGSCAWGSFRSAANPVLRDVFTADPAPLAPDSLGAQVLNQTVPAALTVPVTQILAAMALAIIIYIGLQESIAQRATIGLIVTEGVAPSADGAGYARIPGLYNAAQVEAWKNVTSAVHAEGGTIVMQLWHVGRVSHTSLQPDGGAPVAPSAIAAKTKTVLIHDGVAKFVELGRPGHRLNRGSGPARIVRARRTARRPGRCGPSAG